MIRVGGGFGAVAFLVFAACVGDDPQFGNVAGPGETGAPDSSAAANDSGAADGPSAPDTSSPPDASDTIIVTGKVVAFGEVKNNVALVVAGQNATTSSAGTFTVTGVKPPYDVAIALTPAEITVYRGLTRHDPVLVALGNNGVAFPAQRNAATFAGTVSGGPPLPFVDSPVISVSGLHRLGAGSPGAVVDPATGTFSANSSPRWFGGPSQVFAKVHASLLTGGQSFYGVFNNLPRVPGAVVFADAYFNRFATTEESSAARIARAIGDTNTIDVALAEPPRPLAPLDAATDVRSATAFAFTRFDGGVHRVTFSTTGGGPTVTVFTMETNTTFPDLSGFGASIPKNASYQWRTFGYGPLASLDDDNLVALIDSPDANLPAVAEVRIAASIPRTFMTAP